jgi:hypothetical protein
MDRTAKGTLRGAVIGGVCALLMLSIYASLQFFGHPEDRNRILVEIGVVAGFTVVVAVGVGTLAGYASSYPTDGISFLKCFSFIAVAAAVGRLATMPKPTKGTDFEADLISYLATIIAAVLMTALLTWGGVRYGDDGADSDEPNS